MTKELTRVKEDATGILSSDVLLQVLSRLPPKTLVRFRCVSKQWRNFISDPFFVNFHYSQSKKKKPLLVQVKHVEYRSGCYEVKLIDPLITFSTENFYVNFQSGYDYCVEYCSGLLLFYGRHHYHVCNPSTRECFTANHYRQSEFSPNYSSLKIDVSGFGFLPCTSEYKFVVLFSTSLPEDTHYKFMVITLPSKRDLGSKKYMPMSCLDLENPSDLSFGGSMCVSGIIYWPIERPLNSYSMDLQLLAFDLESEVFRVITCPFHYTSYSSYYLEDFEGEVCLVNRLFRQHVIDMWVLKDQKNEIWAKKYIMDCSTLRTGNHEVTRGLYPLQIVADSYGEKTILIKSNIGVFYYYNLKTKTFTILADSGDCFGGDFVHHGSLFHVPSCRLVKATANWNKKLKRTPKHDCWGNKNSCD